jgi:hypothetical protein
VTTPLMITVVLTISVPCAHLGRTLVQLTLSYLALRHSKPAERKDILHALAPALSAVEAPETSNARPRHSEPTANCQAGHQNRNVM